MKAFASCRTEKGAAPLPGAAPFFAEIYILGVEICAISWQLSFLKNKDNLPSNYHTSITLRSHYYHTYRKFLPLSQ